VRVIVTLIVVALAVLAVGHARGDGLVYQLPKDGVWARFDMELTLTLQGEKTSKMGTLRIASVGQTSENDQPCRWIEVRFASDEKSGVAEIIAKVLVPEKHLKRGESPLEHVLRGWVKEGRGKPKKLDDAASFNDSPLPLVLSGPLKDARPLEKEVVDGKLGRLECEGVTGRLEIKLPERGTIEAAVQSRLHPKAPFGVVSSRWVMKMQSVPLPAGAEAVLNLTLGDFGEGAASELPDSK